MRRPPQIPPGVQKILSLIPTTPAAPPAVPIQNPPAQNYKSMPGTAARDFLPTAPSAGLPQGFGALNVAPLSSYYLRPGATFYYRRPGGADRYVRP